MRIRNLFVVLVLLTVAESLIVFSYFYQQQRERMSELILGSLREDLSQLTYVLSRNLSGGQAPVSQKALLDRAATVNEFIAAITLFDRSTAVLASNPVFSLPPVDAYLFSNNLSQNKILLETEAHARAPVRYYQGAELVVLDLVFFLDHEEIKRYLNISLREAIFGFGVSPLLLLLLLSVFVSYLLVRPLQRLREFAYYHDKVPEQFFIKELESVRHTLRDTFRRLETEQKALYDQARLDALTGLVNRHALQEHAETLIAECRRTGEEFAFVFLDFDNFKSVNDSLGHKTGDEILREGASRLQRAVRSYDLVSRIGGDEFVIVLKGYGSKADLSVSIQRIQSSLADSPLLGDARIYIACSAGVAIYPGDGEDFNTLLKNSDIAMFAAKDQQKGGFRFFSEELNQQVQRNIALENAMRKAFLDGGFRLYYQPKIDLQTGRLEGAEALLRWISADGSEISPAEFIPLAEQNGFIIELGTWVLNEAARQLQEWKSKGLNIRLSINIATRQFLDDGFECKLFNALRSNEVTPEQVDLEITEYLFFAQSNQNQALLSKLHEQGFTLSLDDFGTGYSSMSYLKRFKIDQIKIDKSFVADYRSTSGAVFIESIVRLGHALGKRIIAEGVETEEQLEYLQGLGCNAAQGYYFSKALPPEAFWHYCAGIEAA
jgi:diguanylate cyclase (GGDEF)-like protein